jgi:predicted HD superfamily hydrolase involved in NAD metabolism
MSSQPGRESDSQPNASQLAQYISGKRVAHSENVARAASALAQRWAPELEPQARLAGLLHDNAKSLPPAELLATAEQRGLPISEVERMNPTLLHGKVGAALLKERFGVDDRDVEQACAEHVTGRKGMSLLSRILYVADQAAADRDFDGVERLRALMFEDLDEAVLLVAKHKVLHSAQRGALLEPGTIELYNALLLERANG